MTYKIQAEDLKFACDTSKKTIQGIFDKTLGVKEANAVTAATGSIIRSVATDVRVRLSMQGIDGVEKKANRTPTIEQPAV